MGSELAAGRRLPPPVQAAAPAREDPGGGGRNHEHAVRPSGNCALDLVTGPGPALSTVDLPDPVPDAVVPEDEPSTPKGDVVEQLKTLADLRERGMLDEDEYEKAKHAVLGEDGGA